MARRPEAIYLYGVDIMSSSDCLAYFHGYAPTFVEWLNDSACTLSTVPLHVSQHPYLLVP